MDLIGQSSSFIFFAPGIIGCILLVRHYLGLGLIREHLWVVGTAGVGGLGVSVLFLSWSFLVLLPIGFALAWLSTPLSVLSIGASLLMPKVGSEMDSRGAWGLFALGWSLTVVDFVAMYAGVGAVANS